MLQYVHVEWSIILLLTDVNAIIGIKRGVTDEFWSI